MKLYIFLQLVLLLSFQHTKTSAQQADLVLTNGKIFTSDEKKLFVQALAIKGNKIVATGSNAVIEKLASAKTKRIDLEGKVVVPGFNNAHDHPGRDAQIGKEYAYTNFHPDGLSKSAVLDSVARLVKQAKPGEWIHGLIGVVVLHDSSMRAALDSIAPNNPVALQIWWGHGITLNKKALEASGLHDTDKDPVGGWYIRNAENKISSLEQNAQAPVWIARYKSEPGNLIKGLQAYAQKQLAGGITTVQFMGTGFKAAEALEVWTAANLPQRIRMIAWPRSTAAGRQLIDWDAKSNDPSSLTYLTGIKYVIDGSPMGENALRTVPYTGKPGWYGRINYPIDTLKQIFREALTTDRQLIMHMTADSSFGVVLSLMKGMGSGDQWKAKRVRIEHNCVGEFGTGNISAGNRKTLKDLGILVMHTPKFCMGSPMRSLLDSGIIVGIAPDGTDNPFVEIMLMTSTHPNPKENFTLEQALIAFTKTNAFAEFKEKEKGMLVSGMVADLAVLSQDIFIIPASQLLSTKSILTIVDGKIVYEENKKENKVP
ncbi:MAG: amidohydrolase family protein [Bacteroidota bacterium]